ncbi:hypothetical protein MVEN_02393900 [Mycena venus]|uniref:Uncharacterized protein n=1 Tax=Mycena venus TaxID=2733690 RepID=A0A8H6X282_9AGAR|nr:hypothetical protein MVEN_02393900 [Mycena venus]
MMCTASLRDAYSKSSVTPHKMPTHQVGHWSRSMSRSFHTLFVAFENTLRRIRNTELYNLKSSCKKLDYLLRVGRSSPALRRRMEGLLSQINRIIVPYGCDGFPKLYHKFYALVHWAGKDTGAAIRDLRKLVNEEVEEANHRVREFTAIRRKYAEGRRNIAAIIQDAAQAAKSKGFPEGVSSAEESEQIFRELEKIEKSLETINETLKQSLEFWKGVDRSLRSSSPGQQAKHPPDGISKGPVEIGAQRQAAKIQTGLHTVCSAAQQYVSSKKILKNGNDLVNRATNLLADCTTVVHAETSVQLTFQSGSPDRKTARKVLSPLTSRLNGLVKGYTRLSSRFAKYAQTTYLLFWFAGSTAAEKFGLDKPDIDYAAKDELLSKGISSYVLPFESAFMGIERQLLAIQDFWRKAASSKDAPWALGIGNCIVVPSKRISL